MNKYIWSLDVSTTNVGTALWNTNTGELIELKHLGLKVDKNIESEFRDLIKSDIFEEYCTNYKKHVENELDGEIINIFIEAPLPNTKVNINTTSLLLGFNGMARRILYKVFNIKPIKISVHDSRKLFLPEFVKTKKVKGEIKETLSFPDEWKKDKKEYIRQKVAKLEPQIEWVYNRNNKISQINYDMSDSYCVGYAALKIMGIL